MSGGIRAAVHRLRVDAHAVWLAARDPRTPLAARIVGLMVAGYALSPIDLIPDFVPILGLLDDAVILPLGIWLFVRLVPRPLFEEHRAAAEAASHRPISRGGALAIIILWLAGAVVLGFYIWSWRYW